MRCADRSRQRGAAVILAMLAVALAAAIAAAVLDNLGHSLENAAGRHDQAQARLLARGAVDWARNVLADDRQRTGVDHLKEAWAIKVPPTPVGEGDVGGEIQDWSGRFNMNNLVSDGKPEPGAVAQFGRLLDAAGIANGSAPALAQSVADWMNDRTPSTVTAAGQDGDAAPPANGALANTVELRAIAGFDDGLLNRLQPYITAVPAPARVNVNTASPEVLAALVPGLDLNAARILAAERDRAWFRDLADFNARLSEPAQPPAARDVDVASRYFAVTGRARFGTAVVSMEVLLDRRDTWPAILWQRIP